MDIMPVNLLPHKITELKTEFKTKVLEFENGEEQRFGKWHSPRRTMKFSWNLLSSSDFIELEAFFNAQHGALKKWTFNDYAVGSRPGNRVGSYNVRFANDVLDSKIVNGVFYNVSVEVKTC